MKTKSIIFFLAVTVIASFGLQSCATDPGNNTGLETNTFKFMPAAGGESVHSFSSAIICGMESSAQGPFYSFRGFFNIGANSTYDRLAVGFLTEPADGDYTVIYQQYYAQLPAGNAGVNITYDGYNYAAQSGTVTVATVGGKKQVSFSNVVLGSGGFVTGTGTDHGANSKVTAVMQCP